MERLKLYTGQTTLERFLEWMEAAKKHFAVILGRNRIAPTTNSTLRPTTPTAGQTPFDDLRVFGRWIPNAPAGGGGDNRSFRD